MMIESMLCLLLAAGPDLVLTALVVQQTPEMVFTGPGREVVLDCYHGDNDYPYMLWYQFGSAAGGGRVMALIGLLSYESPSVEKDFQGGFRLTGDARGEAQLRISSVNSTDAAEYFCAARRQGTYEPAHFGSGTKLTVLDPDKEIKPPTVQVFKPSENERKNEQKTLVCVASGFYPDHVSVSWKIDDDVVDVTLDHTKAVATDDAARLDNKTYTITSQLIVSSDVWFSNSEFICNVSFFNGTHTVFRDGNTTGGGIRTDLTRDKYLWITQSAKLSYIIFIAKSCVYGAFIWFVAWKLQRSAAKKSKK